MKRIIIVFAVSLLLFIIFQKAMAMSNEKTENQPYKVIKTEKDFEIRYYPEATMAKVLSKVKNYKELGNTGFRKLAGYIFGSNQDNQQIAMTAPVHMEINDQVSSMSFVMPEGYTTSNLPKPNNPDVLIQKVPAEYAAVVRFGGYASEKDIKKHTEQLDKALKKANITSVGNFRFLGYNAPYDLINRRNEIVVQVEWNKQ